MFSELVGKSVEFFWVHFIFWSTFSSFSSSVFSNPLPVFFGWFIVLRFSELLDSCNKFFSTNLSIVVGINMLEEFIRHFIVNTSSLGFNFSLFFNLNSRGSCNESESSKFHVFLFYFINYKKVLAYIECEKWVYPIKLLYYVSWSVHVKFQLKIFIQVSK